MQQGIIYTRVSSDEQVTGTSLRFQEELCQKYCAERDISVNAIFREEGESAKTADRTELLRALEFCRKHKGQVNAFIVAKVDRFARNTEDHFYVRKLLLEYGVTLYSVTEPIGNRPTEKFVETVLAASAEFDNAIRKQRCTDGLVARIRQGIWPFRPPPGYVCARHRSRGEKKNRPDQPDRTLFPIIRECLIAYAGGYVRSLAALRQLLDSRGLAAARGRPTLPQFVDRLTGKYLAFYSGVLSNPWTGEQHRGLHQPMVSEDEAQRIRLYRSGRSSRLRLKRERFNPEFPLRRTVRCAACGRSLTGAFTRGNGGRYPYYFCGNRCCTHRGKSIPRSCLHKTFLALLAEIRPSTRFLELFEFRFRQAWAERTKLSHQLRAQVAQKIADLDAKRRRIFEMREDGSYDREIFRERLREVEQDLAAAKTEHTSDQESTMNLDRVMNALRQLCSNLTEAWFSLSAPTRQRFEHLIFPGGLSYDRDGNIRTGQLGLIFELHQDSSGLESPNVHLECFSSNQWLEYFSEIQEAAALLNSNREELLAA